MSLAHILLNCICIQVDPPPDGGGFKDPLSVILNLYAAREFK